MSVRQARKDARRAAIVDAGLRLFLENGYDRCSVEQIAAEVGMARGTFYLYFPDKGSLFAALAEQLYGPLVRILEETAEEQRRTPGAADQQALFMRMALKLVGTLHQVAHLAKLHFRESRSAGPSGEVVNTWMERIEALAAGLLAVSGERGFVRPLSAEVAALAIVGATERLAWGWLYGERLDQGLVAVELAELYWRGIRV